METIINLGSDLTVTFAYRVTLGELVLTLAIVSVGLLLAARWVMDWLASLNRPQKETRTL